jgi:hypothetical protein
LHVFGLISMIFPLTSAAIMNFPLEDQSTAPIWSLKISFDAIILLLLLSNIFMERSPPHVTKRWD